jgi:hypothetical protein
MHIKNNYGVPSTFRVPFLYKLGVDAPWSLIKPDAELLKASGIINHKPYIKRKILLDYLGGKEQALLYKSQDGLCSICSTNLHMYMENDENMYLDDEELRFGPSHRNEWYHNQIDPDWNDLPNTYKGLNVDHTIPLAFSNNYPAIYNILDDISNKQLIHLSCHKIKTNEDKLMIKTFKHLIKLYQSEGLNNFESMKLAFSNEEIKKIYMKHKSYVVLMKILSKLIMR